ncbi:uncharacterized protein LOC142348531 [Convolutriloba macropyga]|uniref:uncharacterized protein LOC142348531 n=1 Tax=Convolutriloba macropyga TaxID=536237 RepID=UPI003F51B83E
MRPESSEDIMLIDEHFKPEGNTKQFWVGVARIEIEHYKAFGKISQWVHTDNASRIPIDLTRNQWNAGQPGNNEGHFCGVSRIQNGGKLLADKCIDYNEFICELFD